MSVRFQGDFTQIDTITSTSSSNTSIPSDLDTMCCVTSSINSCEACILPVNHDTISHDGTILKFQVSCVKSDFCTQI